VPSQTYRQFCNATAAHCPARIYILANFSRSGRPTWAQSRGNSLTICSVSQPASGLSLWCLRPIRVTPRRAGQCRSWAWISTLSYNVHRAGGEYLCTIAIVSWQSESVEPMITPLCSRTWLCRFTALGIETCEWAQKSSCESSHPIDHHVRCRDSFSPIQRKGQSPRKRQCEGWARFSPKEKLAA